MEYYFVLLKYSYNITTFDTIRIIKSESQKNSIYILICTLKKKDNPKVEGGDIIFYAINVDI